MCALESTNWIRVSGPQKKLLELLFDRDTLWSTSKNIPLVKNLLEQVNI